MPKLDRKIHRIRRTTALFIYRRILLVLYPTLYRTLLGTESSAPKCWVCSRQFRKKRAKMIAPTKRNNVFWMAKYTCFFCKKVFSEQEKYKLTIDHLIPTSRGGSNEYDNLVAACQKCNELKGEMTLTEFQAHYPRLTK